MLSWKQVAFARFEYSVCRGSLMTIYIMLLSSIVQHSLVHWYQQSVTVHHVPKCMSCHKAIVVITGRAHCFHENKYILPSSCFCETSVLCVSWIIYDHLHYAPCLTCWVLLGSLVRAMYSRTWCAQVHELPQTHCGDNWEGTLFSW